MSFAEGYQFGFHPTVTRRHPSSQRNGRALSLFYSLFFPTIISLLNNACLDRAALEEAKLKERTPQQTLLDQAKAALSRGDFSTAISLFTQLDQLATTMEMRCAATYGLTLGHSLYWVNVLNQSVIKPLITLQQLTPQDTDFGEVLRQYIGPLETPLRRLAELAEAAIANRCDLILEGGLPIELGERDKELYLYVRIGYHFNEPVARVLSAFFNSLLATFDFVLSHSFVISELNEAVTYVTAAYNKMGDPVRDASGNISEYTYITFARSLGIIFAFNPDLLLFHRDPREAQRFNRVDNELAQVFTSLYRKTASGEEGLIPSLLEAARKVTDLTQEVLGVSDENRDGALSGGDRIFVGIRAVTVGNELSLPDNRGGINMIIPRSLGNITELVRNLHELLAKLGDQMKAVDEGGEPSRVGFSELNGIIGSLDLLRTCVDPLPEAVEFDPRQFFLNNPQPLRRYLPYFTPSVGTFTPYEFIIEGESSRPVPDFYVYFRTTTDTPQDFPHFPPTILFPDQNETVNGLNIPMDNLFPSKEFSQPLPYIAWQDPTFHNMLYVNPGLLPVPSEARESPQAFILSTQYLTNKLLNAYLLWLPEHTRCGF